MIALFAILIVAVLGFGLLQPRVVGGRSVLTFGAVHHGRGGAGSWSQGRDSEFRDYLDRQIRWNRRRHRGLWNRQDRRHERHHP